MLLDDSRCRVKGQPAATSVTLSRAGLGQQLPGEAPASKYLLAVFYWRWLTLANVSTSLNNQRSVQT